MYNDKFVKNETIIEHIGKKTYFYNVYLFIERARDLVWIKKCRNDIREFMNEFSRHRFEIMSNKTFCYREADY